MRLPRFVFIAATAAIMIGSGLTLLSCANKAIDGPKPNTKGIATSLDNIDDSTKSIDAKTEGAVIEDTTAIRGETKSLRSENKKTTELQRTNEILHERLAAAETKEKQLVRYAIAGAFALGVLAMVAAFVLRSMSIGLGALGAFVGASLASFVYANAWVFSIVAIVAALGWFAFKVWRDNKTKENDIGAMSVALGEVVGTTEQVKKAIAKAENGAAAVAKLFSNEDSLANKLQSTETKALVALIRKPPAAKGATNAK